MIWVSEQGPPPYVLADPHHEDSNTHSPVGPLGIKIIVGLAVALPMLLAVWFLIARYCHVIKQEQEVENQPSIKMKESPGGTLSSPDWNGYQDDDGQGTLRRHDRHSSEAIVLREPHYRSTYDDDPSVGHRDSFSQKYVADNGILTYTTAEDTEQELKGGTSGRRSILDWIFRDNIPSSAQTSDLQSTDGTLRVRTCDLADFSLKRVSVGYPFESSSFGFVGSNRSTFYDSSTTENNRRSLVVSPTYLQVPSSPAPPSFLGPAPPTPEGQKATQEPDTPQPSHIVHVEPIDFAEQLEVQEEPELPILPESTARKLRRSLCLGSRNRSICHQDQGPFVQELLAPGSQSTRPCHSFGSTGSGYMASMSGSNTSIGSSRNSIDESTEQESEEMVNLRRQRSRERLRMTSNDEYDPESRSSWASYPQEHPEDMELIQECNQFDKHSPTIKHAAATFPRSDSGVMGSSSSSFPNLKVFLRKPKTALSVLTLRPSRSMTHLGQGGSASDTDSSISKCSIRTAPVGSQGVYTRDQGLSVHVNSQRQSVVDMLQSQGVPISPLSAVSAGLPVWNALGGEARDSSGSRVSPRVYSEKDMFCGPELDLHETSIHSTEQDLEEQPSRESLNWVEGQDIRLASSVSQSWNDSNVSRHFSLQSELGIIEQVNQENDVQALPSFPQGEDLSACSLSMPLVSASSSGKDRVQSCILSSESLSRKQSSERLRPISYPVLFNNARNNTIPRNIVKATVGTAFHYAATNRQSMSSTLVFTPSPRVQTSSSQGLSELKAYLVSDPQSASASTDQATCDLARINSLDLERGPQNEHAGQTSFRKTLPDWIQFNSKMRSLWGRPITGTAGEWQVSLVQPATCLGSDKDLELLQSVSSPIEMDQATIENDKFHRGEVEVERVVLLVREQGSTPFNSPPLSPTRSRTLPSLMQLTDLGCLSDPSKAIEMGSVSLPVSPLLGSPTTLSFDRTVGQRVLAERRRLQAQQSEQQAQQQ
ncbi:hypothetical protein BGZ92_010636 [Podila epicladia]|nr:hypothetical protein BGZ92_010636 [Podila epicladia]